MPYGLTDDLIEERKNRVEAVQFIFEVAFGAKTAQDAQKWLEKKYPELWYEKKKNKEQ